MCKPGIERSGSEACTIKEKYIHKTMKMGLCFVSQLTSIVTKSFSQVVSSKGFSVGPMCHFYFRVAYLFGPIHRQSQRAMINSSHCQLLKATPIPYMCKYLYGVIEAAVRRLYQGESQTTLHNQTMEMTQEH